MTEQEDTWDPANPWILNKMIQISERLLDSHESANVIIMVLIALSILPLIGIGFLLTYATTPVHQVEITNQ